MSFYKIITYHIILYGLSMIKIINYIYYMIFLNYMPVTPPEEQKGVMARIFQTSSTAKVIDFFLDHKDLDYSLSEVSEKSRISIQTASKEICHLERMGFLANHRTIGKTVMYRWNSDETVMHLLEQFALHVAQMSSFQTYPEKSGRQEIIETTINS